MLGLEHIPPLVVNLHTCHSKRAQEQPKTKYEPGPLINVIMPLLKGIIYLSQLLIMVNQIKG